MSQLNKWSFVGASAQFSANKNNIKNQYFFGVSICFCSNLLCTNLVLSVSFRVQLREIRNAQKQLFSLPLVSLARGKCKLNSFCMFEEFSQITRPSLRLSLFNCPSISGAESRRGSCGGYQAAKPRREMLGLMSQSSGRLQTSAIEDATASLVMHSQPPNVTLIKKNEPQLRRRV